MPTITISDLSPFDAGTQQHVSFSLNGAQSVANTLKIYAFGSGTQVYSDTDAYPTYAVIHDIPANTLSNGGSYYYTIEAFYNTGMYSCTSAEGLTASSYCFTVNSINYAFTVTTAITTSATLIFDPVNITLTINDVSYNVSVGTAENILTFTQQRISITSSNSKVFYCVATASMAFTNVSSGTIVTASTLNAVLRYEQSNKDPLREYIVNVNTYSGSKFFTSGSRFTFDSTLYQIVASGLDASSIYYFTIDGVSRYFTMPSYSAATSRLSFNAGTGVLSLIDGQTTTAVTTTYGTSGTICSFNIIVQTATISIVGLADDSQYYINAVALAKSGATSRINNTLFSVNYFVPSVYGLLEVENLKTSGAVKLTSNMAAIDGIPNFTPVYYTGGGVDVTGAGNVVKYESGYLVEDGFVMRGIIDNIQLDKSAVVFSTGEHRYTMSFHNNNFGSGNVFYATLQQVGVGKPDFYLMSNKLSGWSSSDKIMFGMKYSGSLYEFIIAEVEDE